MKLISFGKVNKKFLIPLLGGIIALILKYLIILMPKIEMMAENPFILNIYAEIGMILSFIPFIILKYRSKASKIKSNDKRNKSKLGIELIFDDDNIIAKKKCNKYKYILISTLFDLVQSLLTSLFCPNFIYNLWILDIMIMSFFSSLLLKIKIYNHQYLSIIIILLLFLALY